MERRERMLNADEAAVRFAPVLAAGGEVTVTVTGRSMLPYLQPGRDRVRLAAPKRSPRRGDILFFRRPSGEWVLHRVLHRTSTGYVVSGDAQLWTESVKPEQITAVVTAVERDGRLTRADAGRFRVWAAYRTALHPLRRMWARVRRAAPSK